MKIPSAEQLLDIWEIGRTIQDASRIDYLLQAAGLVETSGHANELPLGARDSALISLRSALFGSRLESVAVCPNCATSVEFDLDTRLLNENGAPDPQALVYSGAGYVIQLRPLTGADLDGLDAFESADLSLELLRRSIVTIEHGHEELQPEEIEKLSPEIRLALEERLEAADPLADIRFGLTCPECDTAWQAPFQIGHIFWKELDHWARRMLGAIHALATRYGWSESEILALSPWRRRIYLELISQ